MPLSIITTKPSAPVLRQFLLIVNTIGGFVCEAGGKVTKNLIPVVAITKPAKPLGLSIRVVKFTLAIRVAVIVCVVIAIVVVNPAIVVSVVSVIKFPVVIIVVIAGIILVIVVVKFGVRKTSICKVVVDTIRWEYSRTTGANKSGENAVLDSRFAGAAIL